ncbi:MAG TPA: hypothetical protein VGQ28_06285, partial [Thermoanaerobaculia bacterium]|nr:hypothetical protein [Thermoanaerobaculia bacterium]
RCDASLGLFPLLRRETQKNVVFFHGLFGYPGHWIGNEAIDRYWCNSDYMTRVLTSLLATPNWDQGRLLDPRAFSIVDTVTLPLPFLEMPDGVLMDGPEKLPRAALEALDGNDILGHCVAEKLDEKAIYSIMLTLNHMALQSGIGRRFRLFVERFIYNGIKAMLETVDPEDFPPEFLPLKAALGQLGLTIDDLLIPIPRLAQASLFKVIKACKFALLYHWVPEPFGLLPLESVCLGCPVYTNGAGNLRYLVPEGNGISVFETEGMAFGDLGEYQKVAQRIFQDAVVDPEPAREACRRGAEYIARTYNREAMRRDLAVRLADLGEPPAETDLDATAMGLSPLVRSWNPSNRRVVSDYKSCELSVDEAALLGEILGQGCAGLECRKNLAIRETIERLFQQGVLAVFPPAPPTPEDHLDSPYGVH